MVSHKEITFHHYNNWKSNIYIYTCITQVQSLKVICLRQDKEDGYNYECQFLVLFLTDYSYQDAVTEEVMALLKLTQ